jgi:predicted dinucleotide-binding enzyme
VVVLALPKLAVVSTLTTAAVDEGGTTVVSPVVATDVAVLALLVALLAVVLLETLAIVVLP